MAKQMREYSEALQTLFLEMIICHPENFVRVQNIYNTENFNRSLQQAAEFIKDHAVNHKTLPTIEQTNAVCNLTLKETVGLKEEHYDWFLEEFEGFSQSKELERAILKSADLLEKGERGPILQLIKDAVEIGLVKDIGTDYFKDPRARLLAIRENNGQQSTGWPLVDKALYGGLNRGELNIFSAVSGGGKSLFLMNIAINWILAGLNGIYITLELSEHLCGLRADAMMTNTGTKDIFKNLDDVELKLAMVRKKSGAFQIKYMQAQSNVNAIRSFVNEYTVQTGIKPDFLIVDYLDLVSPAGVKIDPTNLFVKDKYVSEELRNLAKELNVLFVTAAQFNRGGVDEVEFSQSNISGGISKIYTADNAFAIYASRSMREQGKFQLQLIKTRSSSGVGSKLDLDFDMSSMRITDSGIEQQTNSMTSTADNILGKIKSKSVVNDVKAPVASVDSNKLKNMLSQLKSTAK